MKPVPAFSRAKLGIILIVVGYGASAIAQTCPPGNPRVAQDTRYVDHGNGTVTDHQTGLMWKRCSEGQSGATCSGTESLLAWQQALAGASASNFAGHSDWRLPSAKELVSLVETGCYTPAINSNMFPNTNSLIGYWTSTSRATNATQAWTVEFNEGQESESAKSVGGSVGVRLVRGGQ